MSKENKEEIFTFNLSLNDKNATDITVEIINLEDGIGYIGDKNTKKVYIVDYPKFEKLTLLQIKKLLNSFSDDYWLKNPYYDANEWGWQIDADGLRYSLVDFYHRYHKPLFIVENGIGIDETMKDGKVYDDERIAYYQKHIKAINTAVEHDGVDLMGYLAWSPIDFLSSHKEIRKRYGFVYVDRDFEDLKELKRYPKKSFYWYKKVIESQGKDLENDIDY